MLHHAADTTCSTRICNHVLRAVLFVVLYVSGSEIGRALSLPQHFATFWPPSGIFLAALLRTPVRQWPAVVFLALMCNLVSDVGLHNCTVLLSTGFWCVNSVEALTGAWVLRRLLNTGLKCDSLREILGLVLVGGVLNTMVGATLGALLISQGFAGETFADVWRLWWISDLLGVVVMTPVILTLTVPERLWTTAYSGRYSLEGIVALLCLVATSQMVYGPGQHPLAFLVFPVLIWIALRFDMRMASIANVIRTIVAITNTQPGVGPFATSHSLPEQILQVQVMLCLTSGSILVLSVVVLERHRSARILQESETRYRDLLENIGDLVHSVNAEGQILYTNRAWRETLGYSPDELRTLSIFQVIHPDDHPRYRQKLQRVMRGENLGQIEWRFMTSTGQTLIVEGNSNCRFIDGQPAATRSIFRDITCRREHESQLDSYCQRLEDANRQLKLLATTDALTGLQNRRAFQERLVEEVDRAQRYEYQVSLLLLDVDHFKQFNDSFGHLIGDEVLKRVSRILEANARVSDYVARFGGEEFAIILPNTDSAGALALAERFREAIAFEPFPARRITASLGVATLSPEFPLTGDVADCLALIKSADEALYLSKLRGRNQVQLAGETHPAMA